MKTRLLLSLVLLVPLAASAADTNSCGSLPSSSALKSQIEAADTREAFLQIFDMRLGSHATPEWNCFLDKVSRGDESTAGPLVVISKKPFFLAAPDISESLSKALLVKPAFVLPIINDSSNPERSAQVICQIDTPYGITVQAATAAAEKMRASVATVTEPSLSGIRDSCMDSIDLHLKEWKILRGSSASAGDE